MGCQASKGAERHSCCGHRYMRVRRGPAFRRYRNKMPPGKRSVKVHHTTKNGHHIGALRERRTHKCLLDPHRTQDKPLRPTPNAQPALNMPHAWLFGLSARSVAPAYLTGSCFPLFWTSRPGSSSSSLARFLLAVPSPSLSMMSLWPTITNHAKTHIAHTARILRQTQTCTNCSIASLPQAGRTTIVFPQSVNLAGQKITRRLVYHVLASRHETPDDACRTTLRTRALKTRHE